MAHPPASHTFARLSIIRSWFVRLSLSATVGVFALMLVAPLAGLSAQAETGGIGACCSPTGTCIETTQEICDAGGREYLGDGTSCDPNPCDPEPMGACCFPDTTCQILPMTDCAAMGGIFQGDGALCDPLPCGPIGACCLFGPLCTIAERSDCVFGDGTYQGDGTTCTPDPCTVTDAGGNMIVPDRVRLSRPFPNPARDTVSFRIGLPADGRARLRVFDVRGALVADAYDGELPAGVHAFTWNARERGARLAGGIYFVRLEAGSVARTQRVVFLN